MLSESLRILARLWLWVVAALIVALGVGLAVFMAITPTQQSKANVLILPPLRPPGSITAVNPYTALDNSLAIVGAVVQTKVMDQATTSRLYSQGGTAKYVVAPNLAQNAGPTLTVTVTDKVAAVSQRTLSLVLVEIRSTLNGLQADRGVPTEQYITTVVLTSSAHPSVVRKTEIQLAVVAAAVLLLVFIVLILTFERLSRRRRQQLPQRGVDSSPTDIVDAGLDPEPGVEAEADGQPAFAHRRQYQLPQRGVASSPTDIVDAELDPEPGVETEADGQPAFTETGEDARTGAGVLAHASTGAAVSARAEEADAALDPDLEDLDRVVPDADAAHAAGTARR